MSYIRLVNVTKQFGDVTAVNNLNLEIGKGECFSMLGPPAEAKPQTCAWLQALRICPTARSG